MKHLLLCALLSAGTLSCYADVVLSISPASQTVALGSPATFDIDASGLGNGTALGTYDLNVGFDPTLLSYSSSTFGSQLDVSGLGDIQSVSPGNGTVEIFELSLDSPSELLSLQASSFTLATLTFDTLANGSSPLNLSMNAVGDQNGNFVAATLDNGSISIGSTPPPPTPSPVPEPSSIILALSGCAGLYKVKRTRATS